MGSRLGCDSPGWPGGRRPEMGHLKGGQVCWLEKRRRRFRRPTWAGEKEGEIGVGDGERNSREERGMRVV